MVSILYHNEQPHFPSVICLIAQKATHLNMNPVGLVVSVSAAIEHHSVVCTLRVSFQPVLCCGEIIGLHGCIDAAVGSVAVILWLLAEGLAHRLALGVKMIDVRTPIFVSIVIRRVWIKVGFVLVHKRRQ